MGEQWLNYVLVHVFFKTCSFQEQEYLVCPTPANLHGLKWRHWLHRRNGQSDSSCGAFAPKIGKHRWRLGHQYFRHCVILSSIDQAIILCSGASVDNYPIYTNTDALLILIFCLNRWGVMGAPKATVLFTWILSLKGTIICGSTHVQCTCYLCLHTSTMYQTVSYHPTSLLLV